MKYLLFITCLLFSITAHANEAFYGVYEQESFIDEERLKLLGPERAEELRARLDDGRITLEITPEAFSYKVAKFPEEAISIPYEIKGSLLVADNDGRYWVIYLKDPDHIYSTGMAFTRVSELE